MDKKTKRIQVLLAWREFALARGHEVPTEDDLTKIGASGELWPPFIDLTAAEPWRETIAFLLKQVRFGVVDPVDNMPTDLFDPAPAAKPRPAPTLVPPPLTPPGGQFVTQPIADSQKREDPRLIALREWRAAEQARNRGGLGGLKDSQLRSIVSSGSRTVDEIQAHLPQSLADLAPRIAAVLAETDGPTTTTTTTTTPAAPPPAPRPSSDAPTAPANSPLGDLAFARYEYTVGDPDEAVLPVRAAAMTGGGTSLSWPAYDAAGAVIYRVVSGDEYSPYNPDEADIVTVTTSLTATDERPFSSAVRHVQVWRHVGSSIGRAASSQPVLHAKTAVVAPVQNASVTEDAGRVIGYWTMLKGATRVQVHRVPLEAAERVLRRGTPDARYRILPTSTLDTGFIDIDAERGRGYLYQMWVEAETGEGTVLSPSITMRVDVTAMLTPVRDLVVKPAGTSDDFDVFWTAPAGSDVIVFRTERPPDPGAALKTFDDPSALRQAGLPEAAQLRYPWHRLPDGRCHMSGVPWPEADTRAYFTPVTTMGKRVLVGASVPAVRMHGVQDAKIVERTAEQIVTFSWPEGATAVVLFIGPHGVPLDALRARPTYEISRSQYVRQGGVHLRNALPAQGCTIHLMPVAFSEGQRIEGASVSVRYPGLVQLLYHVEHQRGGAAVIKVVSQLDLAWRPGFALVHNFVRLPLAITDGTVLPTVAGGGGAQGGARMVPPRLRRESGDVYWTARVPPSGFIRVFVDVVDDHGVTVALHDPPVTSLRLGAGTGPGR